jgi:hypothetical protein
MEERRGGDWKWVFLWICLPVDIAELMFSLARFQGDGDVKGSAGGDGAADSRHGDDGDVFDLDVGGGFGDEHEGFVQAEEEAFVGFDGAFDAVHVVVAVGENG